ncbi:hypothetical protein BDA96_10G248700 [Sorghum bicolor]|uniref:Uncharacterized protein n=1 Tax=Sorghum bicolor TaxID=4558 RepID=A0A921Q6R3_SORBI|nr:hypothetical protein BDA96_10G248700 [Sorghum bicolor]
MQCGGAGELGDERSVETSGGGVGAPGEDGGGEPVGLGLRVKAAPQVLHRQLQRRPPSRTAGRCTLPLPSPPPWTAPPCRRPCRRTRKRQGRAGAREGRATRRRRRRAARAVEQGRRGGALPRARERAVLGGGGGAAGARQGGAPRRNRVGGGGGMGWLGLIRPGQLGLRRVLQIGHSGKKFSFFFFFFIECHGLGKIIVLLAPFSCGLSTLL